MTGSPVIGEGERDRERSASEVGEGERSLADWWALGGCVQSSFELLKNEVSKEVCFRLVLRFPSASPCLGCR